MYALKRIAAYCIDYALFLIPAFAAIAYAEKSVGKHATPSVPGMMAPLHLLAWGGSLVAPALILGTMTGLTGRTPGKFLMSLKVQDYSGDPPGIAQGILREVVKAVSLGFALGMLYALQALCTRNRTFYDEWLDLEVEDLNPIGLTPTQKNFRKYMREKAKRDEKARREGGR